VFIHPRKIRAKDIIGKFHISITKCLVMMCNSDLLDFNLALGF
jgi:hypothetical protein